MKKTWLRLVAVLIAFGILASTPVSIAAEQYVLKFPDAQPDGTALLIHIRKFGDIVKQKSGGRIGFEAYPGAMMGPAPAVLQQIQMGALDMYRTDVSVLYDFGVNSMQLLSLPYLFDSKQHAQDVLYGEIGDQFLKDVDDANIQFKAIGWLIEPSRNLFLRSKKVTSLPDAKGLKVRVPESEIFLATMAAFGISGTPIPWGEVYTSLQTGVVDGAENTLDTFNVNRFDEVCKFIAMSQHNFNTCVILISKLNWDKFSPADQKLIVDSWKEAVAAYDKYAIDNDVEAKKIAESRGVTIVEMTDKQAWVDSVKSLYDKYATNYKDVLAKIRAAQK